MGSEIFKTTTDAPLIGITRLHTHHQTSRPGLGLYSAHRSRPEILSPQLASRWLRSRLSTDDDELNNTLLRVSWWQPLPMRVFPLSFMPKRLSYRINCRPYKGRCNTAHWWRQTSIRRPSNRQISQAYGDCQLVYLRTTNVYSALDLKSHLRQLPYINISLSLLFSHSPRTCGRSSSSVRVPNTLKHAPKPINVSLKASSARPTYRNTPYLRGSFRLTYESSRTTNCASGIPSGHRKGWAAVSFPIGFCL